MSNHMDSEHPQVGPSWAGLGSYPPYPWEYRGLIEKRGYLSSLDPEYRAFMERFVGEARDAGLSRREAWRRLDSIWRDEPDQLPSPMPPDVSASAVTRMLIEEAWPPSWRMGHVDQSELHLLARYGGMELVRDEPEGMDIALVGPHAEDDLVVEFLSMAGVDPEVAGELRCAALGLVKNMVDRGRGRPWDYAQYYSRSGANAYSKLRLIPCLREREEDHLR